MTIQRAWRGFEARVDSRKRSMARRLAVECRSVVQKRERLLWAKKTILGSWRRYCEKRVRGDAASPALYFRHAHDVDSSVQDIWLSL